MEFRLHLSCLLVCSFIYASNCIPLQLSPSLPDTGTTRAAVLWRRMIDQDPLLASSASMYWRMVSVQNPKAASQDALQARKTTAQNPEMMFRKAFLYRSKRSTNLLYKNLTDDYWRKLAANDPEVAARSSMYWVENPEANMYW